MERLHSLLYEIQIMFLSGTGLFCIQRMLLFDKDCLVGLSNILLQLHNHIS